MPDATVENALDWLVYATGLHPDELIAIGLDRVQINTLGDALRKNRLLNPPKHRPVKRRWFVCQRCVGAFIATYRTNHPRYCPTCASR